MYELTKEIHELLTQVCTKNNIEQIEIGSDYYLLPDDCEPRISAGGDSFDKEISAIQEPQLRQILVGLQVVLGKDKGKHSVSIKKIDLTQNGNFIFVYDYESGDYQSNSGDYFRIDILYDNKKNTQAEAFCQKWLDGLKPLFDREPITVLTELRDILKDLLK